MRFGALHTRTWGTEPMSDRTPMSDGFRRSDFRMCRSELERVLSLPATASSNRRSKGDWMPNCDRRRRHRRHEPLRRPRTRRLGTPRRSRDHDDRQRSLADGLVSVYPIHHHGRDPARRRHTRHRHAAAARSLRALAPTSPTTRRGALERAAQNRLVSSPTFPRCCRPRSVITRPRGVRWRKPSCRR